MTNRYYSPTGAPVTLSRGGSAAIRGEFKLIENGLAEVQAEFDAEVSTRTTSVEAERLERVTAAEVERSERLLAEASLAHDYTLAVAASNVATDKATVATTQAGIATTKAGEAAASAGVAAALVESIAGGPVASVNGRPGPNVIGLVDQEGSDLPLTRQMFKDCGLVVADKGESGTTLQTIDYTAGHEQVITATGPFTIAFSNWAPTGNKSILELECINFGAFIVSWPLVLWVNPDKTTTTNFSTWLSNWGVSALPSSGSAFLKFTTRDAGPTLYGAWA